MRLVIVGSVALDTIHIDGERHGPLLGGSASYASLAAIHWGPVGIVGVVGSDFPAPARATLAGRGVDLEGLAVAAGATFAWEGAYAGNRKDRRTLRTELGVFGEFRPALPRAYRSPAALLLGNIGPTLQSSVLDQTEGVDLVAVDTMNYWIEGAPEALGAVIARADLLLINDEEAALLAGVDDPVAAAPRIRERGPAVVVIKKGPHGVLARGPWGWLGLPALPLETVRDPTGAGDAFAGGLLGYLAGRDWRVREVFAAALAVATAVSSYAIETPGVAGLAAVRAAAVQERCAVLRQMTRFELPAGA